MRKGWYEARLGDVVEKIGMGPFGSNIKVSTFVSEGVPVISGAHLVKSILTEDWFNYILPEHADRLMGSNVRRGDLILTHAGTVGQVSLVPEDSRFERYVVSQRGFYIRPSKSKTVPAYLLLFLKYGDGHSQLMSNINRTGVPSLSQPVTFTKQMRVLLPPLDEQKRIVDVVSSVDSYIDALQQQADSARTARNAVLHELLTAGGDDWTETTLGKTLEIARGGSPRPIRDFITTADDGINWIKIGDATASSKYIYHTEQKIRPEGATRSRVVKSGDFILSNSMSFGRPYIMRSDGCIHDGWLLFSKVEKYFDEDFLYNLLLSDLVQKQFDSLAAGSGVRNLNIEVVKEVIIPLPSLSTQKRIAQIANSMDDVIQSTEKAVVDAKNLRSGLLSDLLSGDHEIPASYDSLLGAA